MFHLSSQGPGIQKQEPSVHWLPLPLVSTRVLSHFSAAQGIGLGTWQDQGRLFRKGPGGSGSPSIRGSHLKMSSLVS